MKTSIISHLVSYHAFMGARNPELYPKKLPINITPFEQIFRKISTLGARGISCAVSGVGHVSIVNRAKNLWSRARFL